MRVRPETAKAVIRVSHKLDYYPSLDDIRVLENRIRDLEDELAGFHAECDKVSVPYDAEGLVRHHRNNAAFAAALQVDAEYRRSET